MLKRAVIALFILACLLIVSIFVVGTLLSAPVPARIGAAPADLAAQDVIIRASDGTEIHGWWCPVPSAKGSVLLLAGVRANRLSMVERARFLRDAGYSTLLVDLRAKGETPGDHITFGWLESRDARAAFEFMRNAQPGAPTAIIGSSLGGAATLLADPVPPADALVLEAVYPTLERATSNRLRKYLGPIGPSLRPFLLAQMQWRLGVKPESLRPVAHMAQVRSRILIINGDKDPNTTPDDARQLYAAAAGPKSLWLVPNAGHVDLHSFAREDYEKRVLALLHDLAQD